MIENSDVVMRYRILGPLQVLDQGHPVSLGGPRVRAVLGILLLNANRTVPASRLSELVWGADAPETASHTLHVHIAGLRKHLPDGPAVLRTRPSGYELAVRGGELDRDIFEARLAEGRRLLAENNWGPAAQTLGEALSLWQGPALADLAQQAFALPEAARLEELRLNALEGRIDADLALGRHAELVGELEGWVTKNPLRERLRAQQMLALYRSRRQAEAAAVYRETRRVLVDEQGLEPSPALQKLLKDVLNQDPGLELPETVVSELPQHSNLPLPLTHLVGRENEKAVLRKLVSTSRLVTLVGAGGIGKTRLATEVARDLISAYEGGAWLTELGGQRDPQLVPQAVALAVNVPERADRPLLDSLAKHLAARRLLLVLDNCEHLVESVARLVDNLLRVCPDLTVIATSRERLGVEGEVIHEVPGLAVPRLGSRERGRSLYQYGAVQLFCERAAQSSPNLRLNEDTDLNLVVRVCQRLDGIPLALELAAARLRMLSPEQLLQRLDDRFSLLSSGRRTALPRQQTLKATIDWSYELLSETERLLFRRLAVFSGRFTVEATEMTCALPPLAAGTTLNVLTTLVDRSLVVMDSGGSDARYRLLETIREYAGEHLRAAGEEATVRDRHAAWYSGLADLALYQIDQTNHERLLARLSDDYENLQSALEWTVLSGGHRVVTLARALAQLWIQRGYVVEGKEGLLTSSLQNTDQITSERADALKDAGLLAQARGDYRVAYELFGEAVRLYEMLNEIKAAAWTSLPLELTALALGDQVSPEDLFLRTVESFRTLGDRWGLSVALNNLGMRAHLLGDRTDRPRLLLEDALTYAREAGDDRLVNAALDSLGQLHLEQDDFDTAQDYWRRCLTASMESGQLEHVAEALIGFGRLAGAQRRYARSLQLIAAGSRLRSSLGIIPHPMEFSRVRAARAEAERSLSRAAAAAAWNSGEKFTSQEAADHALAGR